jgi:acyl transferase domain-containing protein/3-hydroxymyristoyl/3-hydroxydecanoyl-(acyl carrier protein) dehydratase
MAFSPIAIVGRACVLPGALDPAQLWDAVAQGRDLLGPVPEGRWKLARGAAMGAATPPDPDRTWSDRGGYVHGFESVWNPDGFAIPARELEGLDTLVAWTLHCARAARAGCRSDASMRTGAVFGNLGFPSAGFARFAQGVWTGTGGGDARNRFMAAGTADIVRRALALDAGSHCLDAACASSLYAIKLACDRLQEGSADLMLAGAVQGADDLFLHVGFCALSAMSRTGQSRPFHRDADGLVPAEGAAFVALKRLADARRDGDTIHGVIRGIGLANDGRGKGLLAPAEEGQQRALRAAYASAGLDPSRVSLLECHATGTPVGDATELASSAPVFAGNDALPVGSLKSNLGHLITAAGAAGLIKVLEAMRAGQRPPTLHVDAPTEALQGKPFRVLGALEAWPSTGPRIAAISAFGFGGNNAHLVVSEDDPSLACDDATAPAPAPVPLAIVGLGAMAAGAADRDALRDALLDNRPLLDARGEGRLADFALDLDGLRIPPRDLAQALPQQLALLHVARAALADTRGLVRERTGVFVGMEPDPEVARYGTRWRLAEGEGDATWLARARDAVVPALESAAVLGTMPNIPANRLGSQFDFGGAAFTVQAGAASGLEALRIAARALARGELDAALVGAVDFSCEAVHRRSLSDLRSCATPVRPRHRASDVPGDAAVALVVKRLADAERDGDRILARVDFDAGDALAAPDLAPLLGNAFAARGLVHVAAAALTLPQRCAPDGTPLLGDTAAIDVRVDGGEGVRVSAVATNDGGVRGARLHCFAGADRAAVVGALRAGRESLDGPARLVLVAPDDDFAAARERALAHLERGAPAGAGVHFRERPIGGETAFVFAGAGASYHGMGRELLQRLPQLRAHLAQRSRRLPDALAWAFDPAHATPSALQQLWGASALSQLHLELTQDVLGLRADAWMGYSSGETNALIASGTWDDPDALMTEMEASGLMSRELGGEFAAIARAWSLPGVLPSATLVHPEHRHRPVQWESWTVLAPLAEVEAAVAGVDKVYVAIINGENDCLVAGDAAGCARIVARFGEARCLRLDYPLAVHVPEVDGVAEAWLKLHRRPTRVPSGRVYSNGWGRAYVPDTETCAQAILAQAHRCLDLRPAVLAAWNDGVRVFVEHGPRGAYGRAIRDILGEREALVVSLDHKRQGFDATLAAIAALLAAGVAMNHEEFTRAPLATGAPTPARTLRVAAHPPEVALPPRAATDTEGSRMQVMAPAPRLPSVLETSTPAANDVPLPTPPPVAVPAPHPAPAAAAAADAPLSVPALVQAQLARVAQAQRAFAEQQSRMHQRYLASRQASLRMLVDAAQGRPSVAPASAPSPMLPKAPPPPRAVPPAPKPVLAEPVARPVAEPVPVVESRGPTFTRAQLEIHAGGRISEIFGPQFAGQDGYARQVRMPQPPLLLADRVTGLRAEPMSMGKGTIWTESDIANHGEFVHHGYLNPGVMIECGQADLMLISYVGIDAHNRGERVYRLLGCELTYHGDLPRPGDTLRYEITLDGHAAQGDVRLMFFHYECRNGERRQISVREGQAGFFTDAELAESAGCLWSPEAQDIVAQPRLDPPAVANVPRALDREQLEALGRGDGYACFGAGFERLQTHTRTPGIPAGRTCLLDRVTQLEARGGPWGRGYLRAELDIVPDQWFFDGHFKNDPCMPGTLMFDGCLQAMALWLAAQGHTLERDGWRFQPVPELPYKLQCRGQVTPASKRLTTEVFVEEVIAGPVPTVFADLLCTVDGLKAFHARRVALQLVPGWPMDSMPDVVAGLERDDRPVAVVDGFRFDQRSLLATAIGRPSEAFGPIYTRFDGGQRVARLPGPPYLFMSRITDITGPIGVMKAGAKVRCDYDVPADAWYYDRNGNRTMPFAVLLEAALQPCGWLSSYVGSALTEEGELGFRNLDGQGRLLAELHDDCGTLTTEVELTDVSATGGMIIESFKVRCFLGAREVYVLDTVFGFFPPEALANQAGLRTTAAHRELLGREGNRFVDLRGATEANGAPRLADDMLLMLDRIEGWWPQGGAAGLGELRAAQDIDCGEWFFKAHFFQDPVQPGSLGLEAMLQALQWHMREAGMADGIASPRFEPIALERAHQWKYRGQVLPKHKVVHTTLEVTEAGRDARGAYALATASLWADGQRIYEADLGMRIVPGAG